MCVCVSVVLVMAGKRVRGKVRRERGERKEADIVVEGEN